MDRALGRKGSAHMGFRRGARAVAGLALCVIVTGAVLPGISAATEAVPAGGHERWAARYREGGGIDGASSSVVSPDGSRVYVAGNSQGTAGDADFATVAYDAPTGALAWARRYDGPGNSSSDIASSIAISSDGSMVFVTGLSVAGDAAAYATLAYDALSGASLWTRRYDGPGDITGYVPFVAASPDGSRVFVTGVAKGSNGVNDYGTIAYDASTGATAWTRRYNGPGNGSDSATSLTTSPDGSVVYVTGYSPGTTSNSDFATIAYDASTGATRWLQRYNGTGNGYDATPHIAASPDGARVFVTGSSQAPNTFQDIATIAYDASSGVPEWVRRYPGNPGADTPSSIAVSGAGGSIVVVTGTSVTADVRFEFRTIAYDAASGATVWNRRYGNPARYDGAASLVASPDGSTVFVTGHAGGAGTLDDYVTISYDGLTGTTRWEERYNGPGNL